ncbi:MAG: pilus assembly protein [Acidobacteria bacterium]|nr:pilus assembly protein [Acidobacteriota bacterium]
MRGRLGSRRGNAMVEFALGASLLISMLIGTFQFGYTFYIYDGLQAAVRSGARYAAKRAYKSSSAGCITKIQDSVKNMVVYGDPTPAGGSQPIVRGLTTGNVNVTYNPDAKGVPTTVQISVSGFVVDALFHTFTFNNKPEASIPFVGRYAPNECDP